MTLVFLLCSFGIFLYAHHWHVTENMRLMIADIAKLVSMRSLRTTKKIHELERKVSVGRGRRALIREQ